MVKIFERTFEQICADAGVEYNVRNSWNQLLPIVIEKWEPLTRLDVSGSADLCDDIRDRIAIRDVAYIIDTARCAFCKKAESIARAIDYGIGGRTCAACILAGKCYDETWIMRRIFIALINNDSNTAYALIRQGIADVRLIVDSADDDDDIIIKPD